MLLVLVSLAVHPQPADECQALGVVLGAGHPGSCQCVAQLDQASKLQHSRQHAREAAQLQWVLCSVLGAMLQLVVAWSNPPSSPALMPSWTASHPMHAPQGVSPELEMQVLPQMLLPKLLLENLPGHGWAGQTQEMHAWDAPQQMVCWVSELRAWTAQPLLEAAAAALVV